MSEYNVCDDLYSFFNEEGGFAIHSEREQHCNGQDPISGLGAVL
jgi:hypothetical protein